MKKTLTLLVGALLLTQVALSQKKFIPTEAQKAQIGAAPPAHSLPVLSLPEGWPQPSGANRQSQQFSIRPALPLLLGKEGPVAVRVDEQTGLPIMVRGAIRYRLRKYAGKSELENQLFSYLDELKKTMRIQQPSEEFEIRSVSEDEQGYTHVKLQQVWQGVDVYGAELALHLKGGEIRFFNGRYFPTPRVNSLQPKVQKAAALDMALEELALQTPVRTLSAAEKQLIGGPPHTAKLVVYHPGEPVGSERLAWALTLTPNLAEHWAYFIDARNGEVLEKYSLLCRLHHHHPYAGLPAEKPTVVGATEKSPEHIRPLPADGPREATADDLFGRPINIHTYQAGEAFYLIDASREMFDESQTGLPANPSGTVWTIDARNKNPRQDDFAVFQVISEDNTWTNPVAVSAHYNAGLAYEYFKNTFGRNSINGEGGNILSIINVTDDQGASMDDAFWRGVAMFYGNGNQLFSAPLAKALDVAGHEMSHGVIQNTAGLEYNGESGAINESFADIFGVLIDRDDWTVGEEVVNSDFYPSRAMRDLSDPENGGKISGNRGWQPAHIRDQYFGSEDNGGVHINSGIVNYVFFLFASEVGLEQAEQVYYRALTQYLLRSSQFVDLRIAVLQAATDLHPQEPEVRQAAARAFDAVGIVGEQGGNYQEDVEMNNGEDFILYASPDRQNLYIATPEGNLVADPLYAGGLLSRPSVTDDGSVIVFVGADRNIHFFLIDWSVPEVIRSGTLFEGFDWRNIAISRDGNRLAGITGSFDSPASLNNEIYIIDLASDPISSKAYSLYNPTTAQGGLRTDDVLFADRLEWDFTGNVLLYDAFNSIPSGFGNSIDFWDIGFLHAWDGDAQIFGDGTILKLFEGIAEGVTIGNPTFSKNSPYIISFDFSRDGETTSLLGINTETQELGIIFEGNPLFGAPSFSTDDRFIIFNARTNTDREVLAIRALSEDKISGVNEVDIFLTDAADGIWFATGQRDLSTGRSALNGGIPVQLFPNPFDQNLQVSFTIQQAQQVYLELFDLTGRRVFGEKISANAGIVNHSIDGKSLRPGGYILRISTGTGSVSRSVFRMD